MKLLRTGVCLAVAFSVAAHGAVEAWSEAALWMLAAALLAAWAWMALARLRAGGEDSAGDEPFLRGNPLLVPLGALVLLAVAQWAAGLSAYPYATATAALRGVALLALVFVFTQAFRTRGQFVGLAWFLLALGFVAAVQGIAQYHTDPQRLYWFRELSGGGVPFGPYVNRNHFAGLMELVAPLGLALLVLRGGRRELLPLAGLLTIVMVGALFLSASRGGIVSFAAQAGVLLLLLVLVTRAPARRVAAPALAVLLVGGGFLVWLGVGGAVERFVATAQGEVSLGRRVSMATDAWRIFREHPVTGTGFGTLGTVFPAYESHYDGKMAEHAHNDYVQTLAESGVAGGALALLFVVVWLRTALARLAEERDATGMALRAGALAGCCGLLFHGLVDFNLQIPSHTLLFLLLAAAGCARFPMLERRPRALVAE